VAESCARRPAWEELDGGIGGVITFIDGATGKSKRVIVQVKSGHVSIVKAMPLQPPWHSLLSRAHHPAR